MTYTIMNAAFLAGVGTVVVLAHRRLARLGIASRWTATVRTLVLVLLSTAIFDNVIIAAGIVDYAPQHLLGLHVGLVPLEDFAYAIAAATGLPALWVLLGPRNAAIREAPSPGARPHRGEE